MLEEKDFERLIEIFATKEDLRSAVHDLSTKMDELLNAVDAYAKKADAQFQEMAMLSHKVDRHERWIQQLAEKLGVTLKAQPASFENRALTSAPRWYLYRQIRAEWGRKLLGTKEANGEKS